MENNGGTETAFLSTLPPFGNCLDYLGPRRSECAPEIDKWGITVELLRAHGAAFDSLPVPGQLIQQFPFDICGVEIGMAIHYGGIFIVHLLYEYIIQC